MSQPRGRYRRVVECRSRDNEVGDRVWEIKLECGARVTRMKRLSHGTKDHPAPLRVLCACARCAGVTGGR